MPAADAARNFHNDDDTVHFHYEEQGQGPHDEVIRLNHKWKGYDLDKESFLRRLPKVGWTKVERCRLCAWDRFLS